MTTLRSIDPGIVTRCQRKQNIDAAFVISERSAKHFPNVSLKGNRVTRKGYAALVSRGKLVDEGVRISGSRNRSVDVNLPDNNVFKSHPQKLSARHHQCLQSEVR